MFANDSLIPFTQQFYSQLRVQYAKSNCFISPLSVYSALALALSGSAKTSRAELLVALNVKEGVDFGHTIASLGEALLKVPEGDASRTLVLANGLFVDGSFDMNASFSKTLEEAFKVAPHEVDFQSAAEVARQSINSWIAANTCQKIKDLMPPDSVTNLTRLVLANAIYFKGSWKKVFRRDMTMQLPFHTLESVEISVPTMRDTETYLFAEFQELDASALKIPFDIHEMLIVLPSAMDGLPRLLEKLCVESGLKNFKALFDKSKYQAERFELYLPKFNLGGSTIDLKKPLGGMGLKTVFMEGGADFSLITNKEQLHISQIVHQAVIEVNEEGAEAAAATGIAISAFCLPPQFNVNHPFLFFIVTETGVPAFMGHVINPLKA